MPPVNQSWEANLNHPAARSIGRDPGFRNNRPRARGRGTRNGSVARGPGSPLGRWPLALTPNGPPRQAGRRVFNETPGRILLGLSLRAGGVGASGRIDIDLPASPCRINGWKVRTEASRRIGVRTCKASSRKAAADIGPRRRRDPGNGIRQRYREEACLSATGLRSWCSWHWPRRVRPRRTRSAQVRPPRGLPGRADRRSLLRRLRPDAVRRRADGHGHLGQGRRPQGARGADRANGQEVGVDQQGWYTFKVAGAEKPYTVRRPSSRSARASSDPGTSTTGRPRPTRSTSPGPAATAGSTRCRPSATTS